MAAIATEPGSKLDVISEHGAITVRTSADATLRTGVVSFGHGWGGLAVDDSNIDVLMSAAGRTQGGTQQPIMTALPVDITVTSASAM